MNPAGDTITIVGGGLAAASAAATLREEGYAGRVVIVGAEPHLPYERPPLSKGYLTGSDTLESAAVHPAEWYDSHDVELMLAAPATVLDLEAHRVQVGDDTLHYDRLLLATGAVARRLPAADRRGASVAYLRTADDAERIRSRLRPGTRLLVVGGGWIGLEVAASARTLGCEVVVVEPLAQPLLRVLGPTIGEAFAALHRAHGVDLRTGTGVVSIEPRTPRSEEEPAAGATTVHLDDGTSVGADLVVVGVGARPATDLAEGAGLKVADGVVTDEHLRSSHPDVFAAGDVASALHAASGHHRRVEHWDNAIGQGVTAARNMLGAAEVYDRLPYFFSDQYDLGMEYVGHADPGGCDELVVRGDLAGRMFTAFWVRDGGVLAAMHVNEWDAIEPMKAVVGAGRVDLAGLRDPRVPLERLLP